MTPALDNPLGIIQRMESVIILYHSSPTPLSASRIDFRNSRYAFVRLIVDSITCVALSQLRKYMRTIGSTFAVPSGAGFRPASLPSPPYFDLAVCPRFDQFGYVGPQLGSGSFPPLPRLIVNPHWPDRRRAAL
jgi:hypothetical protein